MDKILSLSAIRNRKARLNEEREGLHLRLGDIDEEYAELDEAENFVKRFGEQGGEADPPEDAQQERLPLAPVIRAKTTKDALLLALKIAQEPWQTANEARTRAIQLKGSDIPMATVSPTLSNLKNAGLIVRDGHRVAHASRINESQRATGEEHVDARD